jgi:D-alanyl-D-alanine carboxypeptidase
MMRNIRIYLTAVLFTVAAIVGAVSLATTNSHGQSQKPRTDTGVKPTVMVTDRATNNVAPSMFATAANQNLSLRNELAWTFGSKQQHGWYLYDSLLAQLLKIQADATSADFAAALADWQKTSGLIPNGILDEQSLMAIVSGWQSNRLKDRTPALPDQLMTAPSTDFYDPERLPELRQMTPETYAAYKLMIAAAIADPSLKLAHTTGNELAPAEKFLKVVSAFRSAEYQEQLRRQSPNAGSAGLAVHSPHFTGRALDLYVGGDPVDTKDSNRAIQVNTPVYKWLVRNAERFGFRPYFYEPWHWEYVK